MTIKGFDTILSELDLSPGETELAETSYNPATHVINTSRVIADLYMAHQIRDATDDLIASNKDLASASRRYALGLNLLTFALVVAVVVQTFVPR